MLIEITNEPGSVQAMGHRVSLEAGGEAELKRRCYETLSHLNTPPDSVVFARAEDPPRFGEAQPMEVLPMQAIDIPASVAFLPEAAMLDTPSPETELPDTLPDIPSKIPSVSTARSHKKRA